MLHSALISPGALKPTAGDGIESRRPVLHSLQVFLSITILYFSFSHLCTFISVCNNNNNNNKTVRYSSISNNNNNSRDSKVWRVLSHEFRVVRLYRTFSNYIVTGETRCAG